MAVVYSYVQASPSVNGIYIIECLLYVSGVFQCFKEVHHSSGITSLTQVKEGSLVTEALSCHRRSRLPFEIEVASLQALHHFELVVDHPVFFGDCFEVPREVFTEHGASELLR